MSLSLLWLCHGRLRVGGVLPGAPNRWSLSLRKWVPFLCNKATTSMKVRGLYCRSVSINRVQKLLPLASLMAFFVRYRTDGNLSKAKTGISFSVNFFFFNLLPCQQQAWHKHLLHIFYEENIKNAFLPITGKTEDTLGELPWFPYLLEFLEGCLVPQSQAFSWRRQDLSNPGAAWLLRVGTDMFRWWWVCLWFCAIYVHIKSSCVYLSFLFL